MNMGIGCLDYLLVHSYQTTKVICRSLTHMRKKIDLFIPLGSTSFFVSCLSISLPPFSFSSPFFLFISPFISLSTLSSHSLTLFISFDPFIFLSPLEKICIPLTALFTVFGCERSRWQDQSHISYLCNPLYSTMIYLFPHFHVFISFWKRLIFQW